MGEPNEVSAHDISPEVRERILRESLAAWREQGLISAEQHDLLLAQIAAPPTPARVRKSLRRSTSSGSTLIRK